MGAKSKPVQGMTCGAGDCPSPKVRHDNLTRLKDGRLVCNFCLARLSVPQKEYNPRETRKAPPHDLIRIPLASSRPAFGTTVFHSAQTEDEELSKWGLLRTFLVDDAKDENLSSLRILQNISKSRLIFTNKNTFCIRIIDKISDQEALAEKITNLTLSGKKSKRISLSTIPIELRAGLELEGTLLEVTNLGKGIIPLLEIAGSVEDEKDSKEFIARQLGGILYLGWLLGKKDVLESLLISTLDYTLFLADSTNTSPCFDPEIERNFFLAFARNLPFLLADDMKQIVKESSEKTRLILSEANIELKEQLSQFFVAKSIQVAPRGPIEFLQSLRF